MLIIIICALLGLRVGILFNKKALPESNIWEKGLNYGSGIFVGALIGILIAIMFSSFLGHEQIQQEYEKTEIVALTDNSQISGSFFLASGSIDQEDYYKFYFKTPDGGKQWNSLLARNVIIYEEDRNDAYISKIQNVKSFRKIRKWNYVFIPKFLIDVYIRPTDMYGIHVPKGTIKVENNFRLDMK